MKPKANFKFRPLSLNGIWCVIFGVWLTFFSGVFGSFFGPPGVLQALQLNSLYHSKLQEVESLQDRLLKMQNEAVALEHSHSRQDREIRKVLGYASPDELIFDFSESAEN